MKIYQARLETRNFSFEGFGTNEFAATQALLKALQAHAEQYSLEPTWYDPDAVETREIALLQGYRDREPIGDPAK